jgi:hypothetical protein
MRLVPISVSCSPPVSVFVLSLPASVQPPLGTGQNFFSLIKLVVSLVCSVAEFGCHSSSSSSPIQFLRPGVRSFTLFLREVLCLVLLCEHGGSIAVIYSHASCSL